MTWKATISAFGFVLPAILPTDVSAACVHLVQRPEGQVLINDCAACREVRVERLRPGSATPIYRSYILPPGSVTPLGLKGTGRTRIMRDDVCPTAEPKATQQPMLGQCVSLTNLRSGEPVLLNACDPCRAVVLEMTLPDGNTEQQRYTVMGNMFTPIDPKGATQARVLAETACGR